MYFTSEEHEKKYARLAKDEKNINKKVYLYIVTSDIFAKHLDDCYDFDEDTIKPDSINQSWNTSTTKIMLNIALHLYTLDDEKYPVKLIDIVGGYLDNNNYQVILTALTVCRPIR